MPTALKVGEYKGKLGDLAKRYSDKFFHFPVGRKDVDKYGMIIEEENRSYLLMISNSDKSRYPSAEYDTIVSVMGPEKQRTEEIMRDFEKAAGVEMREAPDFLKNLFESMEAEANKRFK